MCCGFENLAIDNTGDVQKLISSAIRKKKFNRNRRHPSMCIDAVLTSTIRLLKNDDLIQQILKGGNVKRHSSFSTSRPKRKRSRWDMKTREPRNYEIDEELDELTVIFKPVLSTDGTRRLPGVWCDSCLMMCCQCSVFTSVR